jgi:hypothetical protein
LSKNERTTHAVAALVIAVVIASSPRAAAAQSRGPDAPDAPMPSPPSSAPADTPPTAAPSADAGAVKEAARRFKLGTELYAEENYEGALVEFRRAYELTGEYRVLYNIGQICFQLRDYVCALASFESYLAKGGADVAEARRDQIAADVDKLRSRIGLVRITTNVPDAAVSIDDVPRGRTPLPPVALSAGQHKVVALKPGRVTASESVYVAGADTQSVHLDLADATPKPPSSPPSEPTSPPAPASRWTTLSFVGLGSAGALAIAAGITGGLALSASSELASKQYVGPPNAEAVSLRSRVLALRLTSDVLSAAAIVTLGTTLILTLTRKPDGASARQGGQRRATATGASLTVTSAAAGRDLGLGLTGTF